MDIFKRLKAGEAMAFSETDKYNCSNMAIRLYSGLSGSENCKQKG